MSAVKFVVIADSHLYPDAPHNFGPPKMLTKSGEILDETVTAVNSAEPDFIAHAGDLLCGGSSFKIAASVYERSVEEAKEAFLRLHSPMYVAPGNHDCEPHAVSFESFQKAFHTPDTLAVYDIAPDLKLVTANVYEENAVERGNGTWTESLDLELRGVADKCLAQGAGIILMLHPWVTPYFHELDDPALPGTVTNARMLLNTISSLPAVAMVLTGHRHRNRIRLFRDIVVIDTAAIVGYPLGFREMQLNADGYLHCCFRQLNLPKITEASYDRSSEAENREYSGQIPDRDAVLLVPRLRELWRQ